MSGACAACPAVLVECRVPEHDALAELQCACCWFCHQAFVCSRHHSSQRQSQTRMLNPSMPWRFDGKEPASGRAKL